MLIFFYAIPFKSHKRTYLISNIFIAGINIKTVYYFWYVKNLNRKIKQVSNNYLISEWINCFYPSPPPSLFFSHQPFQDNLQVQQFSNKL